MIREAVRPASLEEAVTLQKQGMMFLSGGTLINWAPAQVQTEKVILLEGLLSEKIEKIGETVEIGAGASLQSVIDSEIVPEPLRIGAGYIPSRNIRNMATIGGNIAANRADSYVIPALLALNASVELPDSQKVSVYEYIQAERNDLIVKVILSPLEGTVVIDRALRSSAAYPAAITAVRVSKNDCVIALGCAAPHVICLKSVENEIVGGKWNTEEAIFNAVYSMIDPPASMKETRAYIKYIASTLIARSVEVCRKGVK